MLKEKLPFIEPDPNDVYANSDYLGEHPPEGIPGELRIYVPGVRFGQEGEHVLSTALQGKNALSERISELKDNGRSVDTVLGYNEVILYVYPSYAGYHSEPGSQAQNGA